MNPETMNPTEMNHLTEAIVTAAKRVRKPKTPSIVEEIIRELYSGNYTEESLTTLARLFNREFVAEPVVEKKPRKSKKDTPVVTDGEAPAPAPKEKKPRKSKKDAPVVTEEEAPAPKEKKPRKSKKDAPVVTEEEAPVPSPEEKNATPLLEPEDELPNLELRLEGFLEEEELSDIELSDDEE